MANTTTPDYSPPIWSLHGSAQIRRTWETLDELYQQDQWDPRLAGARAAAEWTMGVSSASPVTNERTDPTRAACQWESHTASMREMGIGREPIEGQSRAHARLYARGAAAWLFWWTGLRALPPWLSRVTPPDPAAS